MAFSTKQRLRGEKFEQQNSDSIVLSGDTTIDINGNISYSSHPNITGDTQLVDKKYVDDNITTGLTASTTYTLSSPSTTTVGGLTSGSILTGKTSNEILEEILVPYLLPTFSSFSISGQATIIEVGTALSGSKTFIWSTTNSGNVETDSIDIRDVTGAVLIASGLTNDNSESVDIGTITNTSPITQSWRGEGENTEAGTFQSSNFTVTSIYPYFWGIESSGGAEPGANRPTANQALITGGSKVVSSSTGTITVTFSSTSDDYIWFAIPSTSKTIWWVSALNNGSIGGSVSPGGNLFPDFDEVSIDDPSANWSGVNYKIYISNYQSSVTAAMELRNS